MQTVLLGLIGDQIGRSKSPLLHRLAGELCGLSVTYRALVPADLGKDFDAVFTDCERGGFRGINVTYPYKERVVERLRIDDAHVQAIGACNTVVFDGSIARGYNTDYTGFVQAYRCAFSDQVPGTVALVGAGGVGKAIGFGLIALGASAIRLADSEPRKARALADSLRRVSQAVRIDVCESVDDAVADSDGVVNATPIGMVAIPGTAVPQALLRGRRWAFDAVYTPVHTQFLNDAREGGAEVITGYELFFHQGVDAFRIFTGLSPDGDELRRRLIGAGAGPDR